MYHGINIMMNINRTEGSRNSSVGAVFLFIYLFSTVYNYAIMNQNVVIRNKKTCKINPEGCVPRKKEDEVMKMDKVLLKLSGEALAGDKKHGFDEKTVADVSRQVKQVLDKGIKVCVVIGGGNFWRGRTSENMDRVKADSIGMLATVMNCIYAADSFRNQGIKTHIMTPFVCGNMTELFNKDTAIEYMDAGEVVFFAGGIGHPYFSTDMATVLMAVEVGVDVILSAKAIDGVYDSDPKVNPNAIKYDSMQMSDIVDKKLGVVDLASAVLAMENKMPMMLFGLNGEDSIVKAVTGGFTGTYVNV